MRTSVNIQRSVRALQEAAAWTIHDLDAAGYRAPSEAADEIASIGRRLMDIAQDLDRVSNNEEAA